MLNIYIKAILHCEKINKKALYLCHLSQWQPKWLNYELLIKLFKLIFIKQRYAVDKVWEQPMIERRIMIKISPVLKLEHK